MGYLTVGVLLLCIVPTKSDVTPKDGKLIQIKQNKIFFCDFEHGLCNMTQNVGGNGTWIDSNVPASTQKNGPEIDHTTGETDGHYLYWKKQFRACTPYLTASSTTCLSFAYHMAGSGTSNITVSAMTDQSTRELVAKRGDQGSGWSEVSVSIQKTAARFRVCWDAHGKSDMSVIAIDDVAIDYGACEAQGLCLQHVEASAQATTIQSLVIGGVPNDSCFQVILGFRFSTLPTSPSASVWLNAVPVIFKNYVQGPQNMPVNKEIVFRVPVSDLKKPVYLTIWAAGTGDYDLLAVKYVEVKQCSDIHPTNPVSGAKTETARNKGDPVSNNTWMYGTVGGACGLVFIYVIVISVVLYKKRYMKTMRKRVDRALQPEYTIPFGVETKSAVFGNPVYDGNFA